MTPLRPTATLAARPRALAVSVGLATLALAACGPDAAPLAPEPPADAVAAPTLVIAPELRTSVGEALGDAAARLAPALDPGAGAPLGAALARLRSAIDAGDGRSTADALHAVRALLDGGARDDADAADRAAVRVVTELVAAALAPRGAAAR